MPMIKIQSSVEIPVALQSDISSVIAETIGKPEKYVMVVVEQAQLMMSGTPGNAVCAEVKSIGGLGPVVNHEISMKLSVLFNDHFGLPAERMYVTFTEVPRDHWGWNGSTFG